MSIFAVDPDNWLPTTFRALKSYLQAYIDTDIYDISEHAPGNELFDKRLPLKKTVIHFELDNPSSKIFGFGDNVIDYQYDEAQQTVVPTEAVWNNLNFDMGIWASQDSGGITSRMDAFQDLTSLLTGSMAFVQMRDATGIEIASFGGGTFIEDQINELPVWRVVGIVLEIRVFSKREPLTPIPYVDGDKILITPDFVDIELDGINDD